VEDERGDGPSVSDPEDATTQDGAEAVGLATGERDHGEISGMNGPEAKNGPEKPRFQGRST
jgi:hypothetical protein